MRERSKNSYARDIQAQESKSKALRDAVEREFPELRNRVFVKLLDEFKI